MTSYMGLELLEAVGNNNYETVEKLVTHSKNKKQIGKRRTLEALLAEKDAQGNTPLHIACSKGFEKIALFLVEMGASLTLINNQGLTPYDQSTPKLRGMMKATQEIRMMKDEIFKSYSHDKRIQSLASNVNDRNNENDQKRENTDRLDDTSSSDEQVRQELISIHKDTQKLLQVMNQHISSEESSSPDL